jgi:5-hydroxyisourate hydrolase
MSQITTHILDTSLGKPAANVPLKLEQKIGESAWKTLAEGTTNADGRVPNLLPKETILPLGTYKMTFYTEGYFAEQNRENFYPVVEIQFHVSDATHYHVPLLLSPFGFSTYRGS